MTYFVVCHTNTCPIAMSLRSVVCVVLRDSRSIEERIIPQVLTAPKAHPLAIAAQGCSRIFPRDKGMNVKHLYDLSHIFLSFVRFSDCERAILI